MSKTNTIEESAAIAIRCIDKVLAAESDDANKWPHGRAMSGLKPSEMRKRLETARATLVIMYPCIQNPFFED